MDDKVKTLYLLLSQDPVYKERIGADLNIFKEKVQNEEKAKLLFDVLNNDPNYKGKFGDDFGVFYDKVKKKDIPESNVQLPGQQGLSGTGSNVPQGTVSADTIPSENLQSPPTQTLPEEQITKPKQVELTGDPKKDFTVILGNIQNTLSDYTSSKIDLESQKRNVETTLNQYLKNIGVTTPIQMLSQSLENIPAEHIEAIDKLRTQYVDVTNKLRGLNDKITSTKTAQEFINKAARVADGSANKTQMGDFISGLMSESWRDFVSLGYNELSKMFDVKAAADKYKNGTSTDDDELLLAAYGILNQAQSGDKSLGFDVGQGIAKMIPYMMQFVATTPVGGSVSGLTKAGVKKALSGITKAQVSNIISKTLGYTAGAAARTPLMTVGYQDYAQRKVGDVVSSVDSDGDIVLKNILPADKNAVGKSVATAFTEVFFEGLGGKATKVLEKIPGVKKVLSKIKMPDSMKNKFMEAAKDQAGWNGIGGEYGEEVATALSQAMLTGDRDPVEVFNVREQLTTFLTVATVGGSMFALSNGINATSKMFDKRKMVADEYAEKLPPDVVNQLNNILKGNDQQAISKKIVDMVNDGDFSQQDINNIINYSFEKTGLGIWEEVKEVSEKEIEKDEKEETVETVEKTEKVESVPLQAKLDELNKKVEGIYAEGREEKPTEPPTAPSTTPSKEEEVPSQSEKGTEVEKTERIEPEAEKPDATVTEGEKVPSKILQSPPTNETVKESKTKLQEDVEGGNGKEIKIKTIVDKLIKKENITNDEQKYFDDNKKDVTEAVGREMLRKAHETTKESEVKKERTEEESEEELDINNAFERYNETVDVYEFVENIRSIAEETGNTDLLDAVAYWDKEQEYNFSISGRHDMTMVEDNFVKKVEDAKLLLIKTQKENAKEETKEGEGLLKPEQATPESHGQPVSTKKSSRPSDYKDIIQLNIALAEGKITKKEYDTHAKKFNVEKERKSNIKEITSKPLTRVRGLRMGMNQATGVYISTESKNRYANNDNPALKVEVEVKNPLVVTDDIGLVNLRNKILNDRINEFGDVDWQTKPKGKNATIDDLSDVGLVKLSDYVTEKLKSDGFDAIYFKESDVQEGELVVFDRNKVTYLESIPDKNKKPDTNPVYKSESGESVYNDNGRLLVFDNNGNEIPYIDKIVVVKKNGIIQRLKDGTPKTRPVYNERNRKARQEYYNNFTFDNGKPYPDVSDAKSPEDANRLIIERSENPQDLITLYETERDVNIMSIQGSKDWHIADAIGKVVGNTKNPVDGKYVKGSFADIDDPNNITGKIARAYFSKDGETLDQVAQGASMSYGGSPDATDFITAQDVSEFIKNYPGGRSEFYNKTTELMDAASERFTQLTGFKLTDEVLQIARNQLNLKAERDAWENKQIGKVNQKMRDDINNPITEESLYLYESLLTKEELNEINRILGEEENRIQLGYEQQLIENEKSNKRTAESLSGKESERSSQEDTKNERIKGKLETELDEKILKIDQEIDRQKKLRQERLNKINNKIEIPFDDVKQGDLFGTKQGDIQEIADNAIKEFNNKIASLQRDKDRLIKERESAIKADKSQVDMFSGEKKKGDKDAIQEQGTGKMDVRQQAEDGKGVGEKNKEYQEPAEKGKEEVGEKVFSQTEQEYIKSVSDEVSGEITDIGSIKNEYYNLIENHVRSGGKISQEVYDNLTDLQKRNFNKQFNVRGDKVEKILQSPTTTTQDKINQLQENTQLRQKDPQEYNRQMEELRKKLREEEREMFEENEVGETGEEYERKSSKKSKTTETGIAQPEVKKEPNVKKGGRAKDWVDTDKMTNDKLGSMEFPELVRMVLQLTGKTPIVGFLGKNRRGVFRAYEGGGEGMIGLIRELFKAGNEKELGKVIAHEIGHLWDWLPTKTLKRGNILGRLSSVRDYYKTLLKEKPESIDNVITPEEREELRKQAKEELKEEYNKGVTEIIEEVTKEVPVYEDIKLTPKDILDIWNDTTGNKSNPDLYEYIATSSSATKRNIIAKALKGLVDESLQGKFSKVLKMQTITEKIKKTIYPAEVTPEAIRKRFGELLKDEINKRRLFDLMTIRQELKDLTHWWRPFDAEANSEYTTYRYKGKELYADAISVLLNDPKALAERAPHFNRAFFNYFEMKPEVKAAYEEFQELINNPDKLLEERYNNTIKGYKEARQKKIDEIKDSKRRKLLNGFIYRVISRVSPLIRRIPDDISTYGTLSERQKLRNEVDKLAMINNMYRVFVDKFVEDIARPLQMVDVDLDKFSAILEYESNISDLRKEKAAPGGMQPEFSAKQLQYINKTFDSNTAQVVEHAVKRFHEMIYDVMKDAYERGELYTDKVWEEVFEKNKDTYVTHQLVKYATNYISPMLKKSMGSLGQLGNVVESTVAKAFAIMNLTEHNVAKRTVSESLFKFDKENISPAKKVVKDGVVTGFKKQPGKWVMTYYEKGKLKGAYVDPHFENVFKIMKPTDLWWISRAADGFNNVFKPTVTSWNPGFTYLFNPIKDAFRTVSNMYAISAKQAIDPNTYADVRINMAKNFLSSIAEGKKALKGNVSGLIQEMIDAGVFDLRTGIAQKFNDVESPSIDIITSRIMNFGKDITTSESNKVRNFVVDKLSKLYEAHMTLSGAIELGTKINAYKYLKSKGFDKEAAGFYVRNYAGTPNYLEGGSISKDTNKYAPFSNVIFQGMRSDFGLATKPRTAGAYWFDKAMGYVIPASVAALATAGLFGDDIKKMMENISAYYRFNYIVIPLGVNENGKTKFLTIPMDETGRMVYALTYGITKALAKEEPPNIRDFQEISKIGTGFVPSISPMFKIFEAWLAYYSAGINPKNYMGYNVIKESDFKDKYGLEAHKQMITWTISTAGGQSIMSFFKYDPLTNTTTEWGLKNAPILGRMYRESSAGETEIYRDIRDNIESENAKQDSKDDKMVEKVVEDFFDKYPEPQIGKRLEKEEFYPELFKKAFPDKKENSQGGFPMNPDEMERWDKVRKTFDLLVVGGLKGPHQNLVRYIINARSNEIKIQYLWRYRNNHSDTEYDAVIDYMTKNGIVSNQFRKMILEMEEYYKTNKGKSELYVPNFEVKK